MTDAAAIIISGSIAAIVAGIPAIIAAHRVAKVHRDFNSKMDEAMRVHGECEHAKGVIRGASEEKARAKNARRHKR